MGAGNKRASILLLLLWLLVPFLQPAAAAPAKYYQEKRFFYDALSIVLNKYIEPLGNWALFTGALQGLQESVGGQHFYLSSAGNMLEAQVKNAPPLLFSRDAIDTNAIELVESLSRVFDAVFEQFPGRDRNRLINGAITGMVATLEPNSYFIGPEDLERIQAQNKGYFEGVGLEITFRDNRVTVVSPYDGTPAFRMGLQPNDRIIAVDGAPTAGLRIMDVSEKIRGRKGDPVTLTIERQGWERPRDFVLVRETISHRTIQSSQLEPGFGYIRIINFLGTTDEDFTAALQNLAAAAPLKGLVLDLRYNPGGLLNQSLGLADFFLSTGVIAFTEGRIAADNKTYYARPGTLPVDHPVVVLVNGGSASGSEVVAASLRKHERAVIVGERTFGKGFIQTIFPVQTGGAIRLTTAMLLAPDGRKIQDVGITPDLPVATTPPDAVSADNDAALPPTVTMGAVLDDPTVRIGLAILKRSLLLQDTPAEELEGLPPELAAAKKRFTGLMKALLEVAENEGHTF